MTQLDTKDPAVRAAIRQRLIERVRQRVAERASQSSPAASASVTESAQDSSAPLPEWARGSPGLSVGPGTDPASIAAGRAGGESIFAADPMYQQAQRLGIQFTGEGPVGSAPAVRGLPPEGAPPEQGPQRSLAGEFVAGGIKLATAPGRAAAAFLGGPGVTRDLQDVYPGLAPQASRSDLAGQVAYGAGATVGGLAPTLPQSGALYAAGRRIAAGLAGAGYFGADAAADVADRGGNPLAQAAAGATSTALGAVQPLAVLGKVPGVQQAVERFGLPRVLEYVARRGTDSVLSGGVNVLQEMAVEQIARAGGAEGRDVNALASFLSGAAATAGLGGALDLAAGGVRGVRAAPEGPLVRSRANNVEPGPRVEPRPEVVDAGSADAGVGPGLLEPDATARLAADLRLRSMIDEARAGRDVAAQRPAQGADQTGVPGRVGDQVGGEVGQGSGSERGVVQGELVDPNVRVDELNARRRHDESGVGTRKVDDGADRAPSTVAEDGLGGRTLEESVDAIALPPLRPLEGQQPGVSVRGQGESPVSSSPDPTSPGRGKDTPSTPEVRLSGDEPDELADVVNYTSARKDMTTRDREAMGLEALDGPERRSWSTALKDAKRQKLPERALADAAAVIAKPRALSDVETAGMVIEANKIKIAHENLRRELDAATDEGAKFGLAEQMLRAEQDFDTLTRAMRASGTEKGRALAAQKLTLDEDFNLVSVLARARQAKEGADVPAADRAQFERLTKMIAEKDAEIARLTKKQADAAAERTIRRHDAKNRKPEATRVQERAALVSKAKELLRAGCR